MQQEQPSGIERDVGSEEQDRTAAQSPEVTINDAHHRLIAAELRDQTDNHAELLFEREWLLHPCECKLELRGNAFALESTLDGTGVVWLKIAPLPHSRAHASEWDLRIEDGSRVFLNRDDPYTWISAEYSGGRWGRMAATHRLQREFRAYHPARDGLFLTNTWGDRSRDAHLSPEFMQREIEAAARLGADVVQIDDGWQKGITANAAAAQTSGGGAWNGFWASDTDFWTENRERFPGGLAPLIAQAHEHGMKFGLWFAPDSSNNAANWQRDAEVLLKLHRELGVNFFKIDALKIESQQGEENLRALFETVLRESNARVTFDLDITAERRFGPFGLVDPGPLFVENRYTDWHRYWPHHTLRVAWQLAHWIDPVRLRIEWLNVARNQELYEDDPLAPAKWQPDALFAITMFCSPLGWFEVQNLPQEYFQQAAPLIATWKEHREQIQRGTILPIGNAPDGAAWTGFVSINEHARSGYLLAFRELNSNDKWQFAVPMLPERSGVCEVLGGNGAARLEAGVLHIRVEEQLGFIWARFAVNA
jgi:alpha-galactosidase